MSSEQAPAARAALDEHYEITRELGRGGTALVYLARERATGAEVAIKLIRAKYIEDEEAQARFAREARFVAQLNHPNIVPVRAVLDLGNSGIALVMAHVAGRTLKQVIRDDGPLSAARATRVMREVGSALGAAHDMGIIHRDVKPENIFIDGDDRAVLADFGLARSMTGDTQLTMGGVAIGTPAYMAPEQIEGTELDARADVYSLGLVAWEMITGHRPWEGESLYAILYHQKHEILPDVRDMRPEMPDRLAEVIVRAIEKERDRRWPSVRAVLHALDEATPLWVSSRRQPETADTTRFVRPPTPVATPVVAVAPPPPLVKDLPVVADRQELVEVKAAAVAASPAIALDHRPSRSSRRVALIGGTASVLALFVVVALVTAVMQGRSEDASRLTTDRSMRPTPAGDVAKPVSIGPPIDSLARGRTDTSRTAARDAAARLQGRASQLPPNQAANDSTARKRAAAAVVQPSAPVSAQVATAPAKTNPAPAPAPPPLFVAPPIASPPTASVATSRVSIVGGGMHSCLVAADGRAFCWGNNDRGQLGNGSTARAASPLLLGGETRFTMVAAGLSHSCAIARGGGAWCWGSNDHGQLGDRSFAQRLAPVRAAEGHVFRSIVTGSAHTCGLDADGIAWCWGSDAHGQLGDSSSHDSGVPVGVSTGAKRFISIAAGWNFTCGLGANGHASCWGENGSGQLGDGLTIDRHEPVPVASDQSFATIATGSAHACGVTTEGAVYCWGRNTNGQLGDGATVDRATPARVHSTAHFVSITAGAVHTCALTDNGEAFCWGRNTYGQLGNGTTTDESVPTSVAGGHVFASVGAFGSHTCGATVSGEAFCWGYNLESQLGDGTRIHRTRPVYVETPGGK